MARKKTRETNEVFYKIIALVLSGIIVIWFISQFWGTKTPNTQTVASKTDTKTLTTFVDEAAAYVELEGENAYDAFRVEEGEWWEGDSYIFVYDLAGNTIVLPPQQELEGTNRYWEKDANGVYFIKELTDGLQNNDTVWVKYEYPKPGSDDVTEKLSYAKKVKVGDKDILVGSGMYLE